MIDELTRRSLSVSTDGTTSPYLMVPVSQLDRVRRLLDGHEIRYSMDENAISLDGKPEIVVIELGHGCPAGRVQAILDEIP